MWKPDKLRITVLAALFIGSFFMPAYFNLSGYKCAKVCLETLFKTGGDFWAEIYYPPFTVTNALTFYFIVLLMFFPHAARLRFLKVLGGVLIFHLLSWPLLNLFGPDSKLSDIQIGYYLWAFAIVSVWVMYKKK